MYKTVKEWKRQMLRPGIWNQRQAEYDDPNQPSQAKSWQVILAFSDSSCSEQLNTQTLVRISQESSQTQSHSRITVMSLSLSLSLNSLSLGLSLDSRTSPSLVLIRSTVRPSLSQFNGLAKEKSIAGKSCFACKSGKVLLRALACPNRLEGCCMKQCNVMSFQEMFQGHCTLWSGQCPNKVQQMHYQCRSFDASVFLPGCACATKSVANL